jgi:hypothetical protein
LRDEPLVGIAGVDHGRNRVDHGAQPLPAFVQHGLERAVILGQLLFEGIRPVLDDLLLFAQRQEIARSRQELVVVDRAEQEIRGAGLQRLVPEFPILVDRDDNDRHVEAERQVAEPSHELGAVDIGHLVVGDHEVGRILFHPFERGDRIFEGLDPCIHLDGRRQLAEDAPVGNPIIDDHDG